MQKPSKLVAVGDILDLHIANETANNEGIAKLDDLVIFVKGAKKGEHCKGRVIDLKRTYVTAEKIS